MTRIEENRHQTTPGQRDLYLTPHIASNANRRIVGREDALATEGDDDSLAAAVAEYTDQRIAMRV